MKIVYAGVHFNGYNSRRGQSFEYVNLFQSLARMRGIKVIEYAFDQIIEKGRESFSRGLIELIQNERPNMLFAFPYTDELESHVLRTVREKLGVPTVAWFADDYWRFWNYSRHWAPYFTLAVTTSPQAMGWYRASGITNVLESQWACNTMLYGPRPNEKDIDVSFVGQYKPSRGRIVTGLRQRGFNVRTFGFGWPEGSIEHDEMLKVFSRSKINLNLNERPSPFEPRVLARLFLKKSVNQIVPDFHLWDNARAWWNFALPHTHARPFELSGCRAFTLSGYSEGIEKYFLPDKEMVFYRTPEELAEKIHYYLTHNEERERVAQAGYERTLRDHTYEKRLRDVFITVLGNKYGT